MSISRIKVVGVLVFLVSVWFHWDDRQAGAQVSGSKSKVLEKTFFDSKLPLLVWQIQPDQKHPKLLGFTPSPKKEGVMIPGGTQWYVTLIPNVSLGGGAPGGGGGVPAVPPQGLPQLKPQSNLSQPIFPYERVAFQQKGAQPKGVQPKKPATGGQGGGGGFGGQPQFGGGVKPNPNINPKNNPNINPKNNPNFNPKNNPNFNPKFNPNVGKNPKTNFKNYAKNFPQGGFGFGGIQGMPMMPNQMGAIGGIPGFPDPMNQAGAFGVAGFVGQPMPQMGGSTGQPMPQAGNFGGTPPAGFGGFAGGIPKLDEKDLQMLIKEVNKQKIPGVAFHYPDFSDNELEALGACTNLETLILFNTGVTEEGLVHLNNFKKLNYLVLVSEELTGSNLAQLKNLSKLQTLELSGDNFTGETLALKNLTGLRDLRLRWTGITDEGLEQLSKSAPGLEHLEILGPEITDEALPHIAQFKGLKSLHLYLPNLTDAGMEKIGKMKNLTSLAVDCAGDGTGMTFNLAALMPPPAGGAPGIPGGGIGGGVGGNLQAPPGAPPLPEDVPAIPTGKITDEGIKHLAGLTRLQKLELGVWDITDEGLSHLKGLTFLKYLKVDGPDLTNKGFAPLKNLKVETLDLRFTKTTPQVCFQLRSMVYLTRLHVSVLTSESDLAVYKKLLPDARVTHPMQDLGQKMP